MNNDFISRSELLKSVELSMRNNPHKDGEVALNHNTEHMHFMNLIRQMPTAYDLDKVVEKIREYADNVAELGGNFLPGVVIKIVKGGGLDDGK